MNFSRRLLFLIFFWALFAGNVCAAGRGDYTKAREAYLARDFDVAIGILDELLADSLKNGDRDIIYDALILKAKCKTHLFDMPEALSLFRSAAHWAHRSGNIAQIAGAMNAQCIIFKFQKRYEKMFAMSERILTMDGVPADLISEAYSLKANYYSEKHLFDSTEYYLQRAIELDVMRNDSSSLPMNYLLLGSLYSRQGKSQLAIEKLLIGESYLREGRDSFKIPPIYSGLAELFIKQLNFTKAFQYAQKAYGISDRLGIGNTKAKMAFTIAKILIRKEQYEEAIAFLDTSIAIFSKNKAYKNQLNALSDLAFCKVQVGDKTSAERYLEAAAALIGDKEKHLEETTAYYLANAALFWESGRKKAAFQQWRKVVKLADEEKNPYEKLVATKWIYLFYKSMGNTVKALHCLEEFKMLSDSLYKIAQYNSVLNFEDKFEKAKIEKQMSQLQAENEIKKLEIAQNKITVVMTSLGILVLIVLLGVIWFFYTAKSTALREVAEKNRVIASALEEKEILIKEIHHRVKNNLQVISSLLSLQTKYISDPNAMEAIIGGKNRVRSMALIHQLLYKENNLMSVRSLDYFPKLLYELFETYSVSSEKITLNTDIDDIYLGIEMLIPIGLITNELVSNSLKYAFVKGEKGSLSFALKDQNDGLTIVVADDGIGSGMEDGKGTKTGFGYQLIKALVKKMNGILSIDNSTGTYVKLIIENYKK